MPVRRLLLSLACVALLAATASPASAATCAGADLPISAATVDSAKSAVLCIVNAERVARGLPTVAANDKLALAAQRHSDDMVARDYFDHFAPAPAPFGTDPGDRIDAAGYDWRSYGENIAAGQRTPRAVMVAWMKSTGHCHNILDPDFSQLGVGINPAAATIPRGSGTWTQDFGLPRGAGTPSTDSGPQNSCSAETTLTGLDNPDVTIPPGTDPPAGDGTPADDGGSPTGDGSDSGTPSGSGTPTDTTSAPVSLGVALRHVGRRLTVRGTLKAAEGTIVRLTLRHHGRRVWQGTARVRNGRFRVVLTVPRKASDFVLTARSGLLRTTANVT